jgi:hypothetical protein
METTAFPVSQGCLKMLFFFLFFLWIFIINTFIFVFNEDFSILFIGKNLIIAKIIYLFNFL